MNRIAHGLVAVVWIFALAAPVAAAPGSVPGERPVGTADHLEGSFTMCGRIVGYTAPAPGTDGSITVAGSVDGADHSFAVADAAVVDPRLGSLAADGEWTCMDVDADSSGRLVSIAVPPTTTRCADVTIQSGTIVLGPGSMSPTTITIDGDAGAFVAADGDLDAILRALGTITSTFTNPCIDIGLAADGSFSALDVDYDLDGLTSPIACGTVDGSPIAYRDPADQPYPQGDEISVDGFAVAASLVAAPYQAVLAFHLDAGQPICLLVAIEDSEIVDVAVLTGGADVAIVCGSLEVRGGFVYVDGILLPEGGTNITFAEPSGADLVVACAELRAQQGAVIGTLSTCGVLESVARTSYTVSGITFSLDQPLDATGISARDDEQPVILDGANPLVAPSAVNRPRLTSQAFPGCAAPSEQPPPGGGGPMLPDTGVQPPRSDGTPAAAGALLLAAAGLAVLVRIRGRAR